jgi:very-short-patch-repair endonuclease
MLQYNPSLKPNSRRLRKTMTDAEQLLWSRIRRKQIRGVQFYRQKPIGDYIIDFYAPKVKMVIEVDGSQHKEIDAIKRDQRREAYLLNLGLLVMRFNNLEVLQETDETMEVIYRRVFERLKSNPS